MLTKDDLNRYSRQIQIPEFGIKGQLSLQKTKIICVGAGGITSPFAMYMVSAGIGILGIIDFDKVELSNLQRQIIYTESDIGKNKAQCSKKKLNQMNSKVIIKTYTEKLTQENAEQILSEYDFIIDGSDNMRTKFLVNDICLKLNKTFIISGINKFNGNIAIFTKQIGCYRCLFDEINSENTGCSGITNTTAGIIGTLSANICLNILIGLSSYKKNTIFVWNGLSLKLNSFDINQNKNCPACSKNKKLNSENSIGIFAHNLDKFSSEITFLDIRSFMERKTIIPNSTHVTINNVINFINKKDIFILYCSNGIKSQTITEQIRIKNFNNVFYIIGGIKAWKIYNNL